MLADNKETAKPNQKSCSGVAGAVGAAGEQKQRCHGQACRRRRCCQGEGDNTTQQYQPGFSWLISLNRQQNESQENVAGSASSKPAAAAGCAWAFLHPRLFVYSGLRMKTTCSTPLVPCLAWPPQQQARHCPAVF